MRITETLPGEAEVAAQRIGDTSRVKCVACGEELVVCPTRMRGRIDCPVCGVSQNVRFSHEEVIGYMTMVSLVRSERISQFLMVRLNEKGLSVECDDGLQSFVGVVGDRDAMFDITETKRVKIRTHLQQIVEIIEGRA